MIQSFIQRHIFSRVSPVQPNSNLPRAFVFALHLSLFLLILIGLAQPLVGQTPVNVTHWRYDTTHAGTNTQETLLTPANVNTASFGKLFSRAVDGYVYAQPLYVSGLTMGDGLVHNVLFVATQHDSIYAFDADSNGGTNAQPLWQISMLSTAYGAAAGATTVPNTDVATSDIVPEIGITGTPAINVATNTLYVVSKTKENGAYFQRLHAINIITGAEQPNSPVVIGATVAGTGNGSSGGQLTFSPLWEMNRGALNYYNGYVYVSFGAHGDNGPWHGWVFGYNATTLAQTGVICLSPTGFGNGIWESGAGLPIDSGGTAGRMFMTTGNGTYSAYPPFNSSVNYGDSIVELSLANGALTPTDAFTAFNQASLSSSDLDQGSGGILQVPDQQGANPHILIQVGKEGRILVLNRDNLGGYAPGGSSNTNALQDIPGAMKGLWSTPAYWNGNMYVWGNGDSAKMFGLNSGVLNTTASSNSIMSSGFPGASFVVSSNGTQNGIAWAVRSDAYSSNGPEILYAFDATNLAKTLYESDTNSARDNPGPSNKFVVPVVTNGKVYLAAAYQVNVFGLLNGQSSAAAPVISPNGGSFTGPVTVSLTTTTPNATIFYTLDGSVPTTASNVYSSTTPLVLSTDVTLRTIASANGYLQSPAASATFNFSTQPPPPVFTPAGGNYSSAQQVTITDTDPQATIYYTTDGSTPSASSTKYTAAFPVSAATTTVKAIAIDPSLNNSNVSTATYVIQAGGATINFGSGFASVAGLTLNGNAKNSDDSRLQLTDGNSFEASSVYYSQPINVQAFTTDFNFQLSSAVADGFTFTIQNSGVTALGSIGGALGYAGIGNSVAVKFDFYNNNGEGNDSTGVYTNGASPTVPAVNMSSSGVILSSGDSIHAHITYDGTTLTTTLTDAVANTTFTFSQAINIPQVVGSNTAYVGFTGGAGGSSSSQKILTWTYSTQTPGVTLAAPTFSPAGGSYLAPQSVSLGSTTSGAVIYYTTNGTTPTTSSTVYSGSIPVTYGTTTIKAIAAANGVLSSVGSATYVVSMPVTPTPVISPAGGTYASSLSVTITDTDASAVIYYTLDGTTPTASSKIYSGAIPVTSSTTVNAIAIDPAMTNSPVASSAYIITTSAAINYASGFPSTAGLSLNGNPVVTGNVLQLTNNFGQISSAFYNKPVNVQSFVTNFTFQLVNAQADGFTFTIQNAGLGALGQSGGSLGYGSSTSTGGIGQSVAVKFDFYSNSGEGSDSTGLYTNGAYPTLPAVDMTSSGVLLTSGDVMQAQLNYNGSTLVLTLTDTVTGKTFSTSFTVNIPQIVGANTAYVGFTAGTGGLDATQNIQAWTYSPGSGTPVTATPTFTPAAGSYTTAQNVTLADPTSGAVIYYTTNGTTPTTSSAVYSAAIPVSNGTTTIEALAVAPGYSASTVATATYKVAPVTATPVFTPAGGNYTSTQSVTLADSTTGAVIYYTTNGTTPTTSSAVYSGAIPVGSGTTTIQAIAVAPSYSQSAVTTATYVVTLPATAAPVLTPAAGSYTTAQSVTIADSTTGAVIYYTTNGTTPTTSSAIYSGAIPVAAGTTTIEALAVAPNYSQSSVTTGKYIITTVTATPTFTPAAGSYTTAQSVTLADATTGAVIYYTTNGTTPTTSSTVYSGAIAVGAGTTTIEALAVAPGYSQSTVATATYKVTPVTAAPKFTPAAGSYTTAQSVTIADATTGAVIYYTTNGTTPTTSSTVYTGAIAVGAGTTTIEALALAPNYSQSTVTTATYKVTPVTAAPTFSPAAGSYTSAQNVTIADATAGAVIYYTTNGTTPTTSSSVYSGAIPVSAASTTIEALALAPNYSQSAVTTAVYKVTLPTAPTPAISPAGGTYTTAQTVTITDSDANAVIYYTLNGTTPTASSTRYSGAITVSASSTVSAVAIDPADQNSAVATAAYVINNGPPPVINYSSGFTSASGLTLNGNPTVTGNVLQLTNGSGQDSTVFVNTPVNVQSFVTNFNFQLVNAQADGFTFTIQNSGPGAYGQSGGSLGYGSSTGSGGIPQSVAVKFDFYSNQGEGSDSTGLFTNGAYPTVPAVDMTSSGVVLTSGDVMQAQLSYNGTTLVLTLTDTVTNKTFSTSFTVNIPQIVGANTAYVGFTAGTGGLGATQNIQSWTYTAGGSVPTASAPVFTPAGGSFTSAQSVTIADATSGAVIYYTTNGTTPNSTSTVYSGAIPVGPGTTTIEAIAIAPSYTQSSVTSATYVVTLPSTPAPTFTPAAGTYATAQSVTIADTDTSAVVHYTLDGTTPTASSPVYSGAIAIPGSTTVNAIAIDPALQNSPVATAAYVITNGAAINFSAGFPSTSAMTLNGNPALTSNLLQLTNNYGQISSAFYNTPVNVQSFVTNFTFQLVNAQADGFTFTIQNAGPGALGQSGGSLGYGSSTSTGGIGQSIAVKFDFYSNSGEGSDSTGLYTNGAYPTVPAVDMTSSGVVLSSGDVMQAQLSYNGTTLVLTLTDTVTGKTFSTSFAVNIPQIVGANTAYVGFTAGTGGLDATQNILTWTYTVGTPHASLSSPVKSQNELARTKGDPSPAFMLASTWRKRPSAMLVKDYEEGSPVAATSAIAAEPHFEPAPGKFEKDTSVQLVSETPGAVIHFTMDGSQPTLQSPVCHAPIEVVGTALTIKAFATATGMKDSPVVTGNYHVRDHD